MKRIKRNSVVKGILKRLLYAGLGIFLVMALSANKACREDYFFATQSDIKSTSPTATTTATATGASSGSATPTGSPTPTDTPEPDISPTTSTEPAGIKPLSLLQELQKASVENPPTPAPSATIQAVSAVSGSASKQPTENWLGHLYGGKEDRSVKVIVAGELIGFQRVLIPLLKNSGIEPLSADRAEQLVAQVGSEPAVIVLDAESAAFAPCATARVVAQNAPPLGAEGTARSYVLVGSAAGGTPTNFLCNGQPLGEVVSAPVSRRALRKAVERAAARSLGAHVSSDVQVEE